MRRYRSDIDGLRALAIIPVVLFHAGMPIVTGGYVGVDVFFVISGYLITMIIVSDLDQMKFSVMSFYERRARRILPALLFVLSACLLAGLVLMPPKQLMELARANVAAVSFFANILAWGETGYFSTAAEWRPLLHTWSLAVEEQFYILFPVLLIVCYRMRFSKSIVVAILLALALVSFLLNILYITEMPGAVFYLAPFRIWELLCGALLAFLPVQSIVGGRFSANIIGVTGLLSILTAVFFYTDQTVFPGIAALLPSLGAVAIILAGANSKNTGFVTSLLSLKYLVFFGKISYSLYLWHWPVLVFLRYRLGASELPFYIALSGVILSVILAVLSWSLVEQPFRKRSALAPKKVVLIGVIALLIASIPSFIIFKNNGIPNRLPKSVVDISNGGQDVDQIRYTCNPIEGGFGTGCMFGGDSIKRPVVFALWGDSHAGALRPALATAFKSEGRARGILLSRASCPPLFGVDQVIKNKDSNEACNIWRNNVLSFLSGEAGDSIKVVFLHARWAVYAHGGKPENINAPFAGIIDKSSNAISRDESLLVFERGLITSVIALMEAGKKVVIVGGMPEPGEDIPLTGALQELWSSSSLLVEKKSIDITKFSERNHAVETILNRVSLRFNIQVLDLSKSLCSNRCIVIDEGKSLYRDSNHLTVYGAEKHVAKAIPKYSSFMDNIK